MPSRFDYRIMESTKMFIPEKKMKANTAREIKRLQDGSIDYQYYAMLAHVARHEEIMSSLTTILDRATRHGTVVSILALILVVPFVFS